MDYMSANMEGIKESYCKVSMMSGLIRSHNTFIKYFLIFSYFSRVKAPMCCGMNSKLSSV